VLTHSRLLAGRRRLLLACLVLAIALLAPAARNAVVVGAHPAAAAGLDAPAAPPFVDTDTIDHPRALPLKLLQQPIVFRDVSARFAHPPAIPGSSAILVDVDRGEILWSSNPHLRRAPASTTKLMSALVALVNFPPDQLITVTPEAADVLSVETRMELVAGERLTARELLTGMLMISANDATKTFPLGTVGIDDYVETMNRQVQALGLHDSNFVNPVGFPDDPTMYSSAYDLAAIATTAYRTYPLFGQITATRDIDLPQSALHRDYRMHNINRLPDIYPAAMGTKSGFTDDAGPCLVSMAVRGGHRLVAVVMNAPRMFDESRALLEWGFGQYGLPPLPPPPSTTPYVSPIRH
jgi:D-alanyl-D-alanine carboxypeptidase (penicillin-binding protein 5/6)